MKKTADMLTTPLAGAGIGLGLGLGARGLKHLLQLSRGRQAKAPIDLAAKTAPVTEVPVEVSEEEANDLKARGVKVKEAGGMSDFAGDVLGGGALAAGTYGGWKALSAYLGARKRRAAEQKLQQSRQRVETLIDGSALPGDEPIQHAMKVAEEQYFEKTAGLGDAAGRFFGNTAGSVLSSTGVGWPLGIAAFLMGARAFRRSSEANKYQSTLGALQRVSEQAPTEPPMVSMVPVVRRKKTQEPDQTLKDADVLSAK